MKRKRSFVLILALVSAALLLTASLTGILIDDGGDPYIFTSLQDAEVEIYGGEGIYRHDSLYKAAMFRGFDWVSLLVCLPLLLWAASLYRRGRLLGKLLLGGIFTYLGYIYLIGVMGNAFNSMFLVWTAIYSVGLFGTALVLIDLEVPALPARLEPGFPRKGLAIYTIALGLFLPISYLAQIVPAYTTGVPPASLEIYTTLELAALELGIMVPLHVVGGLLLLRGRAWGYAMAILLAFAAGTTFMALSVAQALLYFVYGWGGPADVILMVVFAVIASGFAFAAFKRAGEVTV